MSKQIFIAVNGKVQFPVKIEDGQSLTEVAQRAHQAMRLGTSFKAVTVPGLINFIAR